MTNVMTESPENAEALMKDQEAERLAQEALRMAEEAKRAAERLAEVRASLSKSKPRNVGESNNSPPAPVQESREDKGISTMEANGPRKEQGHLDELPIDERMGGDDYHEEIPVVVPSEPTDNKEQQQEKKAETDAVSSVLLRETAEATTENESSGEAQSVETSKEAADALPTSTQPLEEQETSAPPKEDTVESLAAAAGAGMATAAIAMSSKEGCEEPGLLESLGVDKLCNIPYAFSEEKESSEEKNVPSVGTTAAPAKKFTSFDANTMNVKTVVPFKRAYPDPFSGDHDELCGSGTFAGDDCCVGADLTLDKSVSKAEEKSAEDLATKSATCECVIL